MGIVETGGSRALRGSSALWRRLDLPGHDAVQLSERAGGWLLAGVAVFAHEVRTCYSGLWERDAP